MPLGGRARPVQPGQGRDTASSVPTAGSARGRALARPYGRYGGAGRRAAFPWRHATSAFPGRRHAGLGCGQRRVRIGPLTALAPGSLWPFWGPAWAGLRGCSLWFGARVRADRPRCAAAEGPTRPERPLLARLRLGPRTTVTPRLRRPPQAASLAAGWRCPHWAAARRRRQRRRQPRVRCRGTGRARFVGRWRAGAPPGWSLCRPIRCSDARPAGRGHGAPLGCARPGAAAPPRRRPRSAEAMAVRALDLCDEPRRGADSTALRRATRAAEAAVEAERLLPEASAELGRRNFGTPHQGPMAGGRRGGTAAPGTRGWGGTCVRFFVAYVPPRAAGPTASAFVWWRRSESRSSRRPFLRTSTRCCLATRWKSRLERPVARRGHIQRVCCAAAY